MLPPAPWPRIRAPRAPALASRWARASPCGVSMSTMAKGASVAGGLVGEDHHAVISDRPGVGEAETRGRAGIAEQALTRAEHCREDHQAVFVDQPVLHERRHELDAAVHQDVGALGPLQ